MPMLPRGGGLASCPRSRTFDPARTCKICRLPGCFGVFCFGAAVLYAGVDSRFEVCEQSSMVFAHFPSFSYQRNRPRDTPLSAIFLPIPSSIHHTPFQAINLADDGAAPPAAALPPPQAHCQAPAAAAAAAAAAVAAVAAAAAGRGPGIGGSVPPGTLRGKGANFLRRTEQVCACSAVCMIRCNVFVEPAVSVHHRRTPPPLEPLACTSLHAPASRRGGFCLCGSFPRHVHSRMSVLVSSRDFSLNLLTGLGVVVVFFLVHACLVFVMFCRRMYFHLFRL